MKVKATETVSFKHGKYHAPGEIFECPDDVGGELLAKGAVEIPMVPLDSEPTDPPSGADKGKK